MPDDGPEDATGDGTDADSLIAAWLAWAATDRAERASADRSRERWLRQQATEEATASGVLVELAERRARAAVATASTVTAGRIAGVGIDAVLVVTGDREPAVVALEHLVSVQVLRAGRPTDATGARPAGRWSLRDVLDAYGAHRLPVRLTSADGQVWLGTVVGVGADVVSLRVDSGAVHLALAGVVRVEAA